MRTLRSRITAARLTIRRSILLRRRLLAAVFTGVAVLAGLRAAAAPAPPSAWVLTAVADLDAGTVLDAADVTRVAFADGTVPAGASSLDDVTGRTLAAPLRRGEPITDVRLVGPGLLGGYDGGPLAADLVAVPVRIPDADAVALLRVGDRINLLSTDPQGDGTHTVSEGVRVLALPHSSEQTAGLSSGLGGRLVVVGVSAEMSEIVADAATQGFLSVALAR